ncbi:MAG: hypothetical protein HY774_24520 [Acidobacteria bacterium]|nr:hypothetical protein [Acidobacteriota bacterium]
MSFALFHILGLVLTGCLALSGLGWSIQAKTHQEIQPHPQPASQTEPEPPSVPSPPRWKWEYTLRNRTGLKLNQPHVVQLSRTMVDVKGVCEFNPTWRLTVEGRASLDPVHRLGYPTGVWAEPRQVFIEGTVKKIGLKLGLQQLVWGQADGLRVLDVINPLDYREFLLDDFLDSRRPLWMARADIPIGTGSLQVAWIPYFAPGRLPVNTDEFGFGKSFGLGLFEAQAALTGTIATRVEPTRRPAYRLNSSQIGLRYSQTLGNWDVTANFFHGWEDVPTPYPKGVEFSPQPTVVFEPDFDRKTVLGGTGATTFGPVVLRLEAGWNFNRSQFLRKSATDIGFEKKGQFSSVVGLDYSPRQWLWLSGQYFTQVIAAPGSQLFVPKTNHLVSGYAKFNFFRETLRPELFILTGLNQSQYLIRPRVYKSFGDHWSVGLGADFFGGNPKLNAFGFFQNKDRAVLEIKWTK